MKQKNNHARSKQKRKQLRKENTRRKIWVTKAEKLIDNGKLDSVSEKARVAVDLKRRVQIFELERLAARSDRRIINQRQRRKLHRQNPHLRNRK